MKPYVRKSVMIAAFIVTALNTACIRTPLPPVAVIQCVQMSPLEFEVSAEQSYDPDGAIGTYAWDFGDGDTSSASSTSHRYDNAGEFTIQLTVVDDSGFQTSKLEHVVAYYELEVGERSDYTTIQQAIEAAEDGDVISVLSGTYIENLDFLGKAITVKARVSGSATIQAGTKEVSGSALPAVRFHSGESRDSILEGFIVQGPGPSSAQPYSGAGISAVSSSPTIRDCTIQNCDAMEGAGVYAYESNMLMENCRISQCRATLNGGGILMLGESVFPEIQACTISSNRADAGGGIYILTTHETELAEDAVLPLISNCTITSNTAVGNSRIIFANKVGGGIEVGTGCRYLGDENTIVNNSPCNVAYHDCDI